MFNKSKGLQEERHGKPTNERLWHALTLQARARFAKYPSPAASAWVHQQYTQKGGQFVKVKHK